MHVFIPGVQSICSYCAPPKLMAAISLIFPKWEIKEYLKPQELLFFDPLDVIFVHSDHLKNSEGIVNLLQERKPEIKWVGWFCNEENDREASVSIFSHIFKEFLFCPFSNKELQWRLNRLEKERILDEFSSCLGMEEPREPLKIEWLIGKATALRAIVNQIPLLAKSPYPVLIQGETGTGKELLARAIHYHGPRKDQPFLPINCSAIPETLFENELFGHEKGAYTGALGAHKGMLAEAGRGTIFLDEVDSLSLSSQAKLLRVLQEKEIRPLGSSKTLKCEARILSATNADLSHLMKTKGFREDLFYRLNILPVHLPPLRERIEDIPALVQNFLNSWEDGIQKQQVGIDSSCFEKLQAYHWPGNVRELEAVIQRAITLGSGDKINPEDLDIPESPENFNIVGQSLQEAKQYRVNQFEREYLKAALSLTQGNVSLAAKKAGKERRTFQRLMHKYGINRRAFL